MKSAFVVSGLPASGKSTVGIQVAAALGIFCLDKDDFLEALFEERGVGDLAWRQKLSRESDAQFENAARTYGSAVLVSHWRPMNDAGASGTPTEWLNEAFGVVVEIFCDCPVGEAAARFRARARHPGHRDNVRGNDEIVKTLREYANKLPLGIGPVVRVDTAKDLDIGRIISELN